MANNHQESGSRSIIEELNALRERHVSPKSNAMNELHNTLTELEKRLSQMGKFTSEPDHYEAVKPDLYACPEPDRAHRFAKPATQPAETDSLRQINSRLDEISHATIAATRYQNTDHEDVLRLERIERRLTELTQQLDNSVAEQNADMLFRRLGELSQRIDSLNENAHLPEQAIDQLAQQINLLAHQLAKVMENLSNADYQSVDARLEAIAQKLAAAENSAQEPHPALLEKMDNRFKDLTARLDAQYASHYAQGGMLHTLEGRLDDISQQISLNLLQTPQSAEIALAENEAIRNLEGQIANLAHQLGKPSSEFAEIKPRLDAIERSISDNRETLLDAARKAAETAVAHVLEHGSKHDTTIALQLANDMKSLEAIARNAEERNGKTFDTVHSTLVKIVDRLANLEQHIDALPRAAQETFKAKPVANPYSTAPHAATFPASSIADKATTQHNRMPASDEKLGKLTPKNRKEPELNTSVDSAQPDSDTVLDLNTIMKRVREERKLTDSVKHDTHAKADLISVARRAAQQASEEAARIDQASEKETEKKKSSITDIFNRQRKPILMAIGAVVLAIAGLQVGTAFIKQNERSDIITQTLTPEIDKNTTASVTPAQTSLTAPVEQPVPEAVLPQTTIVKHEQESNLAIPEQQQLNLSDTPSVHEPDTSVLDVPADVGTSALREAAANGDAHALFEIGNLYMEGRGVKEDLAEAAKWYAKSAARGFAPALYRLGNFNEKGLGMPRNISKAIDWYQQSAQKGNASAMHNLAVLFASGANGSADNASAVRWFTEAAELGVKDSQYNLGILAAQGLGMPVNLEESYKWFALAAQAGDKDAAEKRDQIGAAMKPHQLERAKNIVELWKAKPLNQEANSLEIPENWSDSKPVAHAPIDMKKAVRNIQLILQKNGYDVGTADGIMGNKTRNAISEIQKANGQEPTGEVNQQLVQLLLEKNK
ncbi:peptidoglycan-binding protein [Brucella gallinifaecis]|uniref:Peptidoglycan-binding protein n=1 Tax=Brucella gallinifaecis TaxID=215590 RepID=A0A502BK42_9HYPH|nr:SEL1-like repeat protein [Brucella gallinifaecis]TPF74197.1 peptidoglycan-binding protein [Brucella gallinifaecis]